MSGKDPLPREQAYEGVRAVNPPDIISSVRAPNANDKKYPLGTMWMDTVTQVSYQLVSSPGVWAILGGAAGGDLQTLTTSDATVVAPVLGNINVTQGANILTTGAAGTVTIATVASPTFTDMTATGDVLVGNNITATAGNITASAGNILATLGDVTVALGDITATAGIITAGAGFVATTGGLTATAGNIVATAGDITASVGNITATAGDIIATAGDITATAGIITAGAGFVATTGGLTATAGNIVATAGGITATAGDITATAGDIIVTAGDIRTSGANAIIEMSGAASQVRVHGGAVTDFIGIAALTAGTVTIANTNILSTDRIFITRIDDNGSTALGQFTYVITGGINFVVTALQAAAPAVTEVNDTSIFAYFIIRQI